MPPPFSRVRGSEAIGAVFCSIEGEWAPPVNGEEKYVGTGAIASIYFLNGKGLEKIVF